MKDLLDLVVTAHGGIDRWNQVDRINVKASITGGIWYVKGKPEALKDVIIEADAHRQHLTMDFPGKNKRSIFEPKRVVIADEGGYELQSRDDPARSMLGKTLETPWDDVDVAYFSGEALWTYLTVPFLYTYPGVITEELTPWEENGEKWRRLKITFPEDIVSHNRMAISYFGEDGLLRRHDYTVDVLGGATGANYASDYKNVDGIIFPNTRRIYAYDSAQKKVPEPLLVAIDMGKITFTQQPDTLLRAAG
jgi:hypothetical protein